MTAPNAAEFVLLSIGDSCGADPWSARVPLDPLFARRINSFVCVRHTESTTWPAEVAALQPRTGVFWDEVGCSAVGVVARRLREEGGERSRGGGARADGRSAHGFHPPGVWGRCFNFQSRRITRQGASSSDVLIDENRVSVGVHREKTGRARRALVCLFHHLHALRLQLAL